MTTEFTRSTDVKVKPFNHERHERHENWEEGAARCAPTRTKGGAL